MQVDHAGILKAEVRSHFVRIEGPYEARRNEQASWKNLKARDGYTPSHPILGICSPPLPRRLPGTRRLHCLYDRHPAFSNQRCICTSDRNRIPCYQVSSAFQNSYFPNSWFVSVPRAASPARPSKQNSIAKANHALVEAVSDVFNVALASRQCNSSCLQWILRATLILTFL